MQVLRGEWLYYVLEAMKNTIDLCIPSYYDLALLLKLLFSLWFLLGYCNAFPK